MSKMYKKVSACAQGANYFTRRQGGKLIQVVCPTKFLTERLAMKKQREEASVYEEEAHSKKKLYKMAPVAVTAGVGAVVLKTAGMGKVLKASGVAKAVRSAILRATPGWKKYIKYTMGRGITLKDAQHMAKRKFGLL